MEPESGAGNLKSALSLHSMLSRGGSLISIDCSTSNAVVRQHELFDVVSVAVGPKHWAAVTEGTKHSFFTEYPSDGAIYICKDDENGHIVHDSPLSLSSLSSPPHALKRLPLQKCERVACGTSHTVVICDHGREIWTLDDCGDASLSSESTPIRVSIGSTAPVISVVAGDGFSAVLTSDGCCFSWGKDCLGPNTPIDLPFKAVSIGIGRNSVVAISSKGSALLGSETIDVADIVCVSGHGDSFIVVDGGGSVWNVSFNSVEKLSFPPCRSVSDTCLLSNDGRIYMASDTTPIPVSGAPVLLVASYGSTVVAVQSRIKPLPMLRPVSGQSLLHTASLRQRKAETERVSMASQLASMHASTTAVHRDAVSMAQTLDVETQRRREADAQLSTMRLKYDSVARHRSEQQRTLRQLEQDVQIASHTVATSEGERERLREQLTDLQARHRSADAKSSELSTVLVSLTNAERELRQQCAEYEAAIENMRNREASSKRALQSLMSVFATVKDDADTAEHRRVEAEERLAQIRSDVANNEAAVTRVDTAYDKLVQDKLDSDALLLQAQSRLKDVQETRRQVMDETSRLRDEALLCDEEIEAMEDAHLSVLRQAKHTQEQHSHAQAALSTAQEALNLVRSEHEEVKASLRHVSNITANEMKMIEEKRDQLTDTEAMVDAEKESLALLLDEIAAAEERLVEIRGEIGQAEIDTDEAWKLVQDEEPVHQRAIELAHEAQSALDSIMASRMSAEGDRDRAEAELIAAESRLDEAVALVHHYSVECEKAENDREVAENEACDLIDAVKRHTSARREAEDTAAQAKAETVIEMEALELANDELVEAQDKLDGVMAQRNAAEGDLVRVKGELETALMAVDDANASMSDAERRLSAAKHHHEEAVNAKNHAIEESTRLEQEQETALSDAQDAQYKREQAMAATEQAVAQAKQMCLERRTADMGRIKAEKDLAFEQHALDEAVSRRDEAVAVLTAAQQARSTAENKRDEALASLDDARQRRKDGEAELANIKIEMAASLDAVNAAKIEVETLSRQLIGLRESGARSEETLMGLQSEAAQLRSTRQVAVETCDALRQEIVTNQSMAQSLAAERVSLEEGLRRDRDRVALLSADMDQLRASATGAAATLIDVETEHSRLSDEVSMHRQVKAEQDAVLRSLRDEYRRSVDAVDNTKRQVNECKTAIARMRRDGAAHREEEQRMRKIQESSEAQINTAHDMMVKLKDDVTAVEQEASDEKDKLSHLKELYDTAVMERDELIGEAQIMSERLTEARRAGAHAASIAVQARDGLNQAKADHDAATDEYTSAVTQLNDLTLQTGQMKEEIAIEQSLVRSAEADIIELSADLERATLRRAALMREKTKTAPLDRRVDGLAGSVRFARDQAVAAQTDASRIADALLDDTVYQSFIDDEISDMEDARDTMVNLLDQLDEE